MKSQSSKLALSLQRDALRFAEADADGNMDLSFEEFVNMQPHKVRETHGEAVLREWFDAADTDHSGTVSINEFLIWSLAKEQARSGDDSGLRAMFSVYDKDGSGTVDSREFAKICDDIGFGSAASDIFQDLDKDGSGMVNYHELLDLLGAAAAAPPATGKGGKAAADGGVAGTQTKLFLMAAAWHDHDQDSAAEIAQSFDTSGWKYDAKDATGLANQLRANLKSTQLSIADLIELFNYSETRDGKGGSVGSSRADTSYFSISAEEFVRAMRERFGFSGDDGLLREVFGSINRNNDGALEPSELFEFIEQRTLQLRRSEADAEETEKMLKSLHLKPVYPHPEGKAWSSEDLRSELQACLAKHNVAPHWLIEHWDGDDSGVLSSREFLSKAKKLFVDDEASNKLWYESVRGTVISTFDVLAGADRQLDVVEFEQWQAKRALRHKPKPKPPPGSSKLDEHHDREDRAAELAIKRRGGYRARSPTLGERLAEIRVAKPRREDVPLWYDQASPERASRLSPKKRNSSEGPRVWQLEPTTPLYEGQIKTSCATHFAVSVSSAAGSSSPSFVKAERRRNSAELAVDLQQAVAAWKRVEQGSPLPEDKRVISPQHLRSIPTVSTSAAY